ncbi:MAG: DNA-directed RNA polymerase subunit omega [Thermotoga sp. 50_1627]|uniref:DNA-directed RNA polymerase subunit omega n=1 Tax=Pseudothermotoga sp. TaxID=2033661 RepID=UPI00076D6F1F|nr:MAG: DNA-directed RNA polymerase subunit omega [Thermotoga sp. 50_64]KUK24886.1 MAG: DNA-directed RNA polymerase subunit omega [Thermotoga sp. 50_1627]MBC7116214.1 DNA-directed RNA polymerase subunit omega [Pseudothermotoga sp.]MDK2923348.1 DNA-directed polymerase subunit omega [Pseudothermotoga sp.]HBT38762.1 DNA-directed RNA polymerase subunit omega [Pseudothermotoga sp.]
MSKQILHYDRLSQKIPYKYAIPIAVAKRAEALKEYAKPYVTPIDNNPVSIAFQEIQAGYVRIKNEEILRILLPNVK